VHVGPEGELMEFAELVRKRRTVRRFEDTPVDRAVLEKIARLAQRTPSAGFSQDQRVVIVTDPGQRRRVAGACDESFYAEAGYGHWISECAAQFIPCVGEQIYHRRYQEADKDRGRRGDRMADAVLVGRHRQDSDGSHARGPRCRARRGLRRATGRAGAEGPAGLPDEFEPIGIIPVGRPLPHKRSPSLKRGWLPFEEFAHWERW
jgi:nitroreductase